MPVAFRLPLQVFFEREARHPRKTLLVQPIGGESYTPSPGAKSATRPVAPRTGCARASCPPVRTLP